MVKRLESSWFSFQSTIEKIQGHHQNALNKIDEYEKTIFIRTEYFTRVNLFLAKCSSALIDLKELDHTHSTYVIELTEKLEEVINKSYFKHYKDYQDENGGNFNNIVNFMNSKGKTIIVGTL